MNDAVPDANDVPLQVDRLLETAVERRASDLHLEPLADRYVARLRVDGLLNDVETLDKAVGRSIVQRLMVLGHLLTYRLDVPQEGRITAPLPALGQTLELRVSIMPTTHGLRAAVRLPAELIQPRRLDELGLPDSVLADLKQFAATDTGLLLLTGPAGSGKTTTIYALLEYIAEVQPGVSIIALEDPVERDLAGVTQIEVRPFGELTYETALRSMLRQDPQVLMLGEIRDRDTASIAVQAALSGHRLISTLHAGDPAGTVARLMEMQLAPYQITSALFGVVAQRLLRRVNAAGQYEGRVPVAEFARLNGAWRQAVLDHADTETLREQLNSQPGHTTIHQAAEAAVQHGWTNQIEVQRVLGA